MLGCVAPKINTSGPGRCKWLSYGYLLSLQSSVKEMYSGYIEGSQKPSWGLCLHPQDTEKPPYIPWTSQVPCHHRPHGYRIGPWHQMILFNGSKSPQALVPLHSRPGHLEDKSGPAAKAWVLRRGALEHSRALKHGRVATGEGSPG